MEGAESPRKLLLASPVERADAVATNCAMLPRDASANALNSEAATDKGKSKMRKPYTITKQRERWSDDEHRKFMEALRLYGRAWRKIEEHIGTKTAVQIRSHAQKFFSKMERRKEAGHHTSTDDIMIPPPRPKKKPARPYPRKDACESSENWETHTSQSNGQGSFTALNSYKSVFGPPFGSPGPLIPKPPTAAGSMTPPGGEAEVTEATVAAVAAAASAAAAAAAAAVVAAAGQQVQAHLQANPPHGFPFFGVVPPILAQIAQMQQSGRREPKTMFEVQEAVHKSALVEALAAMQKAAEEERQPSIEDYDADGTCTTDGTRMSASAHTQGCDGDSACSRELPEPEPAVVPFAWHPHRHKQGDEPVARSAGSSWDVPMNRLAAAQDNPASWLGALKSAAGAKHPIATWGPGQGGKSLQHYQGSCAPKPHNEVTQQPSAFASHQPQRTNQQRTRRESSPEGRSASNGSGLPSRAANTTGSGWRRQPSDGKDGPPTKRLKASPEGSDNTPQQEPGSPSLQDMGRPSANTGAGTGTGSNETNGSNIQHGNNKCAPGSSNTNGGRTHLNLWTEAQASCLTLQASGYGSNGHTSNGNGHTSNGAGAGASANINSNGNGSNGNGTSAWHGSNAQGGVATNGTHGGVNGASNMGHGARHGSNGHGNGSGNGSNVNGNGGSSGGIGNGGTYSCGTGYGTNGNGHSIKDSTYGHNGNGNGYSSGNAVSWHPKNQRLTAQHSSDIAHTAQGRETRVRNHAKTLGASRNASIQPPPEEPELSCSEPDTPSDPAASQERSQGGLSQGGSQLHRTPPQIILTPSMPPPSLTLAPSTQLAPTVPSLPLSAPPGSDLSALSLMVAALQAQASLGPFLPHVASAHVQHAPTPPIPSAPLAQHPIPLLSGPATHASPPLIPPALSPNSSLVAPLQPPNPLITALVPPTNPLLNPQTPQPPTPAVLPLTSQQSAPLAPSLSPPAPGALVPPLSLAPEATLLARLVAAQPHGNPAAVAAMFPEALTAMLSVAQRHAAHAEEPPPLPAVTALRNDELHIQRSLLALSQLGAFANLDLDLAKIAGGLSDHTVPEQVPNPAEAIPNLANVVEHLSAFKKHNSSM